MRRHGGGGNRLEEDALGILLVHAVQIAFVVLEHGEGNRSLLIMSRHGDQRVMIIGIDRQEGNAPFGKAAMQVDQRRHVPVGQRALGSQENDHLGRRLAKFRKSPDAALLVQQGLRVTAIDKDTSVYPLPRAVQGMRFSRAKRTKSHTIRK